MIKNILWDFDGVILDSMKIRDWGFKEIFKSFRSHDVDRLLEFHRKNGGLSRYVKIRFFYEQILGKEIDEKLTLNYAEEFSYLMRKELVNPSNLIKDSLKFIKENNRKFNFHIVSGSDQEELRYLCKMLKIDSFFISIHGSPTPKNELVKNLLEKYNYNLKDTILIGDSINDYQAAQINKIAFFGYNNPSLKQIDSNYIETFLNFK